MDVPGRPTLRSAAWSRTRAIDNHHVQERSDEYSSQLRRSRPYGKHRFGTPSGGYCHREASPAVVRPRRHTDPPISDLPFSVYGDSVQTLASPPVLCEHGPPVRAKASRCVPLFQLWAAVN